MSKQDTPDVGYQEDTTAGGTVSTRYVSTHVATSPPVVAVYARLIEHDLEAIRVMVREEVRKALHPEEDEELDLDMPPISSTRLIAKVIDRGKAIPDFHLEDEVQTEQAESNPYREIVEEIFHHPMVSEVHRCRECGVPIIHMEHLKLDEAQAIQDRAYALLGIRDVLYEDEEGQP